MEKKKLSGRAGLKIIWVLISYIGVFCLMTGASAYWTVYDRTGYGAFTDIFTSQEKEYLDSDYFNSLYLDSANSLSDYIGFQKAFETDHAYDGEKLINIESYRNEKKSQPDKAEDAQGASYYLKDLLKWADEGLEFEMAEDATVETSTTETEERAHLQEALLDVLDSISEDFIYYKELEEKFTDTNFKYYIFDDDTGVFYTNTEFMKKADAKAELKKLGRFVEMDSKAKGYETNMQLGYRELHENFIGYSGIFRSYGSRYGISCFGCIHTAWNAL